MLDIAIRGGTIVDGSGLPAFRGDVGVAGGKIVSVGPALANAARVIDAAGRVVAPGFVDPHTHFDAQLCWDPQARPSLEHGVTSMVPGNCSLSLAPLRKDQRGRFSRMFRQIEEMPEAAFYLWPEVDNDERFTRELFERQNITLLPGSYIARSMPDGANPGRGRVRISLVAKVPECIEAASRIREFVRTRK